MVEHGPFALGHRGELLEHAHENFDVGLVDALQFVELVAAFGGAWIEMSQAVMGFLDADLVPAGAARLVVEHEGRNARGVGSQGKHEEIGEQMGVLQVVGRHTVGQLHFRWRVQLMPCGEINPALDGADGLEVFVKFLLVDAAQLSAEPFGIFAHGVENAGAIHIGLRVGEEAVVNVARIEFLSHRRSRATPRDVGLVHVAAVGIAAQLQGRQSRVPGPPDWR